MLNNFGKGPFPVHKLMVKDGEWMATILVVIVLMLFNTQEWTIVGLALIHLLLGLHVLKEHKTLYGERDLWMKRLIAGICWILSLYIFPVMFVYAVYNYAILARDIRKKNGAGAYQIAWKTYMRMLAVTGLAVFVYVVHLTAAFYAAKALKASAGVAVNG